MNWDKNIIEWLMKDDNPAIEYRTKTELLREKAIDWIKGILPADWKDAKGLWLTYRYNAIAECGINGFDFGIKKSDIVNYFQKKSF